MAKRKYIIPVKEGRERELELYLLKKSNYGLDYDNDYENGREVHKVGCLFEDGSIASIKKVRTKSGWDRKLMLYNVPIVLRKELEKIARGKY